MYILLCLFRHICDGIIQCPYGDDEQSCAKYDCQGLFHCTQTVSICLHLSSVCDEFEDCLSGEDELLCSIPEYCPLECECLMFAVKCGNISLHSVHSFFNPIIVFYEFTNVLFLESKENREDISIGILNGTLVLVWSASNMKGIFKMITFDTGTLQLLDFSFNNLVSVKSDYFCGAFGMRVLLLAHNRLQAIDNNGFACLYFLEKLDLSHNNLIELSQKMFINIKLYILNITANYFDHIDPHVDRDLTADIVATQDYRICCLINAHSQCLAEPQWPESCSVMLNNIFSKVITALEFSFILPLNMAAIKFSTHFQSRQKLTVFQVMMFVLNGNDVGFGLYLICIFGADQYFGPTYVVHAAKWLSSIVCKGLGILSSFVMLNSLFLLNLISLSRFMSVRFPFSVYFRTLIPKFLFVGSVMNVSVSVFTLYLYHSTERNTLMPSSSCLLLGETLSSVTVQFLTAVMVCIQLLSLVSVTGFYSVIVYELQKTVIVHSYKPKSDRKVLVQSLLLTLSNALCWVPSSVIFTASLVMETYPTNLLMWNAVLINPLNSVINPIIFCVFPLLSRHHRKASVKSSSKT